MACGSLGSAVEELSEDLQTLRLTKPKIFPVLLFTEKFANLRHKGFRAETRSRAIMRGKGYGADTQGICWSRPVRVLPTLLNIHIYTKIWHALQITGSCVFPLGRHCKLSNYCLPFATKKTQFCWGWPYTVLNIHLPSLPFIYECPCDNGMELPGKIQVSWQKDITGTHISQPLPHSFLAAYIENAVQKCSCPLQP